MGKNKDTIDKWEMPKTMSKAKNNKEKAELTKNGRVMQTAVIVLVLTIGAAWYGIIVHNEQVRDRAEELRLTELQRKQQEQISKALNLALRYYKKQKYAEASSALKTVFDLYRKNAEIRRLRNKTLQKYAPEDVLVNSSYEKYDGVENFDKAVRKIKVMIETAALFDNEDHPAAVKRTVPVYALKLLAELIDASYYRSLSYNSIQGLTDMEDEAETYLKNLTLPLPPDLKLVPYAVYAPLTGLAPGSKTAQDLQKEWVEKLRLPLEVASGKTGIKLRLIPPGTFSMGSPSSEKGREFDEAQHRVTLTKAFYCGKFEITQGQWKYVMGNNPSNFTWMGDNAPVEQVNWDECREFLDKLCALEGVPSGTYRLLTEAQWEYACRAGTVSRFCFGDNDSGLYKYGNYCDRSCSEDYAWRDENHNDGSDETAPVGSFKPNAWGLYDMHGNVWEWCRDGYDKNYGGNSSDPTGPSSGFGNVDRGGSWNFTTLYCRSAYRYVHWHSYRCYDLGFRIMRIIPDKMIKNKTAGDRSSRR